MHPESNEPKPQQHHQPAEVFPDRDLEAEVPEEFLAAHAEEFFASGVDAGFTPQAVAPPLSVRKPKIIALLNQKGGVGKTTSTVNLGAALARFGQRVLLVDLDPQSNLSLHFGVESGPEQRTVRDLLLDPSCTARDAMQTARPGLDFIPAVTELALVEGELSQQAGMQGLLREKLESIYESYDIILLDCPPSLGVLSVNALTVADEVFVPMQAHYLPLRGLEKLLQTVHLISQGLNPLIRVTGILLCMHDDGSSHARAVIAEIQSQLQQFRSADVPWSGATVLQPPVRRNIKLAEAPSFGQTIFDYAPSCPGADDYRVLAENLLERWGLPHEHFQGRKARVSSPSRTSTSSRALRSPVRVRSSKRNKQSQPVGAASKRFKSGKVTQISQPRRAKSSATRAPTAKGGSAKRAASRPTVIGKNGTKSGATSRKAHPVKVAASKPKTVKPVRGASARTGRARTKSIPLAKIAKKKSRAASRPQVKRRTATGRRAVSRSKGHLRSGGLSL